MRLRTRNGQLSLGSIYKLVVFGWTFSWMLLVAVMFVVMLLVSLSGGPLTVNGERVTDTGVFFVSALPTMLLIPVVVFIQGLIFGGVFVLAMMIYRIFRPITVETESASVFS